MEAVYDIRKIFEFLPHRYPFILVDRIIEIVPDERIVGLKNVTINEPFFQGHFPGAPVMPGVLIVEAMAQAGGILVYASRSEEGHKGPVYFLGIDKARFRKPVIPGDQLVFEVIWTKRRGNVSKMSAKATVEGTLVAEAEIMAMTGEET
ncbi:MAG: 3-hydroxyacyl-[acyl-carrier-protein] dehydratase FabZ [Desulfobacterales bacterium S3730MH5]|nr:MAG: 3-hydroxyacyl-[acyl-carrier-protein] dehydratase FabZ [Desulfobacterales bacterium S3730MH5]OEU78585.1 MAG: 3-hydroxyacyl-[acyl-carrier-protein] dehydratase FabZ [Desulfobacterales bacterium S5133MH4]